MKTKISIIIFFLTFNIFSQSEPSWINNYPTDSQYYTGIGSSNTGNKSDDYERALIQARLNLASEISTNIKAETEISTSDSTSGGLSESFTEKINQSVEQYLKELEIVDSYYSTRQGYWIYIRLNKNRWKEIQNEEIASLLQRIQQIINDEYFGTRATTSDKLYKLASASSLLDQSPYSGILSGDVGPFYSGNVFDFLQSEIYRISSDISLKMIENEISLESGESKEIRLNCSSSDYYVGKLPVSIINMNNNIIEALTDINGLVRVNISSDLLTEGKNTLLFTIDPLRIGFPDNKNYLDSFIPGSKELAVLIESSSVYLRINTNKNNLEFVNEPVGSLFASGNEKFKISNDSQSARYELVVSLNFTDYPRVLENAPLMAGVDCIISLKKENRILYEFKNATIKDGGLSYEQAYRRVFNKLIRSLEQDRTYIRAIESEIE